MIRAKFTPNSHERPWLVSWTLQWLDAVDRQAGRVRSAPDTGDGQVEILLFVAALRQVIRGSEALLGPGHPAVREFHGSIPGAVDVRDMLEHFDAYLAGRGKLQNVDSKPWDVHFSTDEPTGGERVIHIGDRSVNVPEAAVAAKRLAWAAVDVETRSTGLVPD